MFLLKLPTLLEHLRSDIALHSYCLIPITAHSPALGKWFQGVSFYEAIFAASVEESKRAFHSRCCAQQQKKKKKKK